MKTLPTGANGEIYYGPRTFEDAIAQVRNLQSDYDESWNDAVEKVAKIVDRGGYTQIAAKLREEIA